MTTNLDPRRMERHWTVLCSKIGDRRAGSKGEAAAAAYLIEQFSALGLTEVGQEAFPCVSVDQSEAEVATRIGGQLIPAPARVLAGSPSTPHGAPVEGDLVWVEMPEQARRLFTPALRGRIVVLVGPTPTRADLHRRLVACQPAAVIHLDDRLPFEWVKDDGVYPAWVERYGMPPTVAVPFRLGWEMRKQGAAWARVRINVQLRQANSQNVTAEIAGRQPGLPAILLGAHHDTQCHNSGADDNASGVVALLEMAALLKNERPKRSIRFVSFGAEEQLSAGSAVYVRRHRKELDGLGVVLNLDSVASILGHYWLIRSGPQAFGKWMLGRLAKLGLDVVDRPAPMPFADHFPFSVFGVPAMTVYRPNMDSGMRWQHHSAHDTLDNVSVEEEGRLVTALSRLVSGLASKAKLPFGPGIEPQHRAETARLAWDLFGLSSSVRRRAGRLE